LRDKRSDGSIGDVAHAARASDHNPDGRGWVHALDIDADLGPDNAAELLANALLTYARHRLPGSDRLKNIVFRNRVASGTYADQFWVWRADSTLGHEAHIHVSFTTRGETDASPFPLYELTPTLQTPEAAVPLTTDDLDKITRAVWTTPVGDVDGAPSWWNALLAEIPAEWPPAPTTRVPVALTAEDVTAIADAVVALIVERLGAS
jgi:hypothetical protein